MKALPIDSSCSIARDVARHGAEARTLKQLLRARWKRPMADEQRRLAALRRATTELLVTLAHRRGRLHQRNAPEGFAGDWDPHAHAARLAERVFARYAHDVGGAAAAEPTARPGPAETVR